MLNSYSTCTRAWLQTQCARSSALVLSGTAYRAQSLCNPVAQRRPTESKSARCCCAKGGKDYKKEGPRFMQRPVAKWRTRGAVGKISDRYRCLEAVERLRQSCATII